MKKKYIIALEDRNVWSCGFPAKTLLLSDVSIFGTDLASVNTGIELTPYTEPDLEQVRKEAYEEGKKQAKAQAELDVCHDIEKVAKENYKVGLGDAWEAVGKIYNMCSDVRHKIFKENLIRKILSDYTAPEAIEKLKTYEQEQEQEEIKVGDEVGYYGVADEHGNVCYSGIVLEIKKDDYLVMEKDGRTYQLQKKLVMSKTGRHFPEIAAVLQKMRGEKDVPETY